MLTIDEVHEILNDNLVLTRKLYSDDTIKVIKQEELSRVAKQIVEAQKESD